MHVVNDYSPKELAQLPVITIITVVYNAAAALEVTIQSVLGVAYDNICYVVIDGGSTDGSVDVIKKYEDKISYWVSEKDAGIYDAMNKGWSHAKPESYILYLGAGDRIINLPENMLNYDKSTVIYGRVLLGYDQVFNSSAGLQLRVFNSLHHQALLINKSLHLQPPFSLEYPKYADFDFNQRLMKQAVRFVYDDSFYAYASPEGVTASYDIRESLKIVRSNFGWIWVFLTAAAYSGIKVLPILKMFRPIKSCPRRRG